MSNQFAPKPNTPNVPPATSGKAVAALVLGILSLGFSCLTAIPALIVGFLAIGDINRSRGQLGGKGLAITGIVVSLVMPLISIVIGGIMVAMLLPAIQALGALLERFPKKQHAANWARDAQLPRCAQIIPLRWDR